MNNQPIVSRDDFKHFRRLRVILKTGDILNYGGGQRTLVTHADKSGYSEQPIKKNGEFRSNRWGVLLGWSGAQPKQVERGVFLFVMATSSTCKYLLTRHNKTLQTTAYSPLILRSLYAASELSVRRLLPSS